ncbi:MAG TPA: hypothetical protein VEV62_16965, partial [Parafilimonas sp.]|nr:hypothetical protein [Parafilimonas sp.]
MVDKNQFENEMQGMLFPPKDNSTYEERVGPPDEFHAVIGRISVNFSALEETLSKCIIRILGQTNEVGHIITSELSFRSKIGLFSSLYLKLRDKCHFNEFENSGTEHFKTLIKALNKAEDLRNQVIHSSFDRSGHDHKITRTKITSKQK